MSNFEIKNWEVLGRNSLGIRLFLRQFSQFPHCHPHNNHLKFQIRGVTRETTV